MEYDLATPFSCGRLVAPEYEFVAFEDRFLRDHATAKYLSFQEELDANVFPCLGRREGCLRLMQEIASRNSFVPQATWLVYHCDAVSRKREPVGTIQGIEVDGWGAIQNIGIVTKHRRRGLGSQLISRAAKGFREAGLIAMTLEVTIENTAAIRLYERLGFQRAKIVYKIAEVAGA